MPFVTFEGVDVRELELVSLSPTEELQKVLAAIAQNMRSPQGSQS